MDAQRPKVGVGLMIVKDGKTLLGRRKGAHGLGEYGGLGGHLENQETFEDCARREAAEEAGSQFKFKNLRMLCVTNLRRYAPKHYIDIGMVAEWVSGDPERMEPDKIEGWEWFDLDDLPEPLFAVLPNYIEAYKTGKFYFED